MSRPIFFDASGKRRKWMLRGLFALILLIAAAAVVLAASIAEVSVPDPLPLRMEHPQPRALPAQIASIKHGLTKRVRNAERRLGWLPKTPAPRGGDDPIMSAFYVPWDDGSRASLQRHAGELDWVVPGLASVSGPKHDFVYRHDPIFTRIINSQLHRPKVLPMVQNAVAGNWDGKGTAAMFADPAARKRVIDSTADMLTAEHAAGVVFDFEDLPATAHRNYLRFLAEAHARFAPLGLLVTATVPVGDPDWNLAAYAKVADRLFIMDYDEHYMGGEAGPIASQPWFVQQLRESVKAIGPAKSIVAIGSYAYDWHGEVDALSIEEAWLAAHDSAATIAFDPVSGNPTFSYEEDGVAHHIWMLDAATAWNQLRATRIAGVGGLALWRLGSEDPGIWPVFAAYGKTQIPDISTIVPVGNVDVEGNGEILRIESVPTNGSRTISMDSRGLVHDEKFNSLPTPYVVRRTGYIPGKVALTFDDGPDGEWTPKILDILKAKGVPATFFVIGENAMSHPTLLNRIIDQGSEIGSHSYTHPNLALESEQGTKIELNATQRLIQAYTGRSVRLFRAPYFGDAEPTTADELVPALLAQRAGYVNVGLHVDTEDWQRPGVDEIVNNAITQVEAGNPERSGQVVLLHDGGGDRSQTVEALPRIIDGLKARGYTFVTASALAGLDNAQAMPVVEGSDLLAVRADVGIFLFLAGLQWLLKWLFFVAITLGIARAVLIAALAVRSNAKANRPVPPPIDPNRFVSVIIPAFNEARVIESSVNRVLASTSVRIEVIVVDDGSTDETSPIVATAFAGDSRVRLLTLLNGGKAHALNQALKMASGDIVVALDADTQFEPETIARLSRWFADESIGAVAGNAKVGNRINLATRWQSVEYVTAQNLERRALDRFDAITVVPGAVGAWRRTALDAVGGYPVDTLAEDQDLTIAIQRKDWLVHYDIDAVAWTEAPETLRSLAKQRFRWAFGTLQCLWKHRSVLRTGKPAGLALVGLPQAWLFQIVFALISPVIDLALVTSAISTTIRVHQHGWAQTHSDLIRMGVYWLAFTSIDVLCGWIAYRLEPREKRFPMFLLLAQRFVYRQLMYSVVIRAVSAAMSGPWVGWGKLERSGKVAAVQQ